MKNTKKSPVLMKTQSGYEHIFASITEAAKFAGISQWNMSLKMEVFGFFEDKKGNKYYRQDKMKTKNTYTATSPKIQKEHKKKHHINTKARRVVVDGVLYNSIQEAERKCGFCQDTVGQALRKGKTTTLGHTIAYADDLPQFKINQEVKQPIVDTKPKEEKTTIVVDSEDPAIKAINDKIVEILKKAGVYDEIQSLSKAIKKLSK